VPFCNNRYVKAKSGPYCSKVDRALAPKFREKNRDLIEERPSEVLL